MKNRKPKTQNIISKKPNMGKKKSKRSQSYYSFLTIILLICLIQIFSSAILNISKIIAYKQKISAIAKTQEEAEHRNQELKKDLRTFSSVATLESIARNNLKMASKDEVLVLVNPKKNPPPLKKSLLMNKNEMKKYEIFND